MSLQNTFSTAKKLAAVSLQNTFSTAQNIAAGVAVSCACIFMPAPCRVCGDLLDNASLIPLCDACIADIQPLPAPLCHTCGRPLPSHLAPSPIPASSPTPPPPAPLCRLCRAHTYSFTRARSLALYNHALRSAILLLKYDRLTRLASFFASRLATLAHSSLSDLTFDVVVPVPLTPARLRERGYNQAELIARPLARLLRIPLASPLLTRTRPRPSKLLLSRRERWTSVRGAFATHPRAHVDNLRVLLVDDVFTTGATLDACSKALLQAGALSVCGLTVARIISEAASPSLGHPTASKSRATS